MAHGKDYVNFILEDRIKIIDFIAKTSAKMFDYINEHPNSKFILFYKNLTHSDLPTFGKATRPDSHYKNLLYYIKESEMRNIERNTFKSQLPFKYILKHRY